MLGLESATPVSWVRRVEENLDAVLIDHAHCEKKAAGTAMSMIFAYVEHEPYVRVLPAVVREELEHFEQVLAVLRARKVAFVGQPQSAYGSHLAALIRKWEPAKAIDRCLVAALIEARSCERFTLLRDRLEDRELASFYGGLLESEGRHHGLYIKLATHWAPKETIMSRLEELAHQEAALATGEAKLVRLHS